MKHVILTLLLFAAVCCAEDYVIIFSGDSRMAMEAPEALPSGDGWEVMEINPPEIPPGHMDEGNPGDWIHNSAWWMLNSIPHDYAQCYLGCAWPDYLPADCCLEIPNVGKGTRQNLVRALRRIGLFRLQDGLQEHGMKGDSDDRHKLNDEIEENFHKLPREAELRSGDVLHLVLFGTTARVQVNGSGEYPAFCCAWPEPDPPEQQPNCSVQGGPMIFPTTTLPGEPGLREYINEVRGDGTVILYLFFADAAWWNGWLATVPNLIVYNGAGYNHAAWIADDLDTDGFPFDENVFRCGETCIDTFLIFESVAYVGAIYRGYFTNGNYACRTFDANRDMKISFYEALETAIDLNSQDAADFWGSSDLDFNVWEYYDDETPDDTGSGLIVDNFPNPFNPTTVLNFNLPETGLVSVKVYNLLGREVESIERVFPAGLQSVHLDLSNKPSGIYFARVTAGNHTGVRKIALMK